MRKDQVKLSQVGKNKQIPALIYKGTFDNHMKFGDQSGQSHSGLHLISEFKKADEQPLKTSDIVKGRSYTGTLNTRQTTVKIIEVDATTGTFTADVEIYGKAKTSTFFPPALNLAKAKECIEAAWKDHCTYGTAEYGGGNVDIYKQMREKFKLNWLGMAKINGRTTWVGCAHAGPVVTAFPAVNNKFR
ncbi:MAG TPA: hypothetical protein VKB86_02145 [Pyrinomonadaceae bacterium]|nr:hypothetical protein [Pyrinomonadaceae bacterium]